MEPAANGPRPSPRYGWLAAVVPADARRFRVDDAELAAALAAAGADVVDDEPDVDIHSRNGVRADAACSIVTVRAREPRSTMRLVRGAQRLTRAAVVRGQATRARKQLAARGYGSVRHLEWDRGTSARFDGSERAAVRAMAHNFPLNAVVVGRRAAGPTVFDSAVAAAAAELDRPLEVESLVLAASGVIVATASDVVLRVGVGPAAARIDEQRIALQELAALDPPPVVAERVPWVVAHGRAGLAVWSAERRLGGRRARPHLDGALLRDCLDFLVALHRLGAGSDPRPLADDARVVATVARPASSSAIERLGEELDERLAPVPRGFAHGDFWTGNLLLDAEILGGVVDWPSAGTGALPLLDLLHLKANAARERTGRQLGEVIADDFLPLADSGGDDVVRAYCRRIGLDPSRELLRDLVRAYWIQALAHELLDPDRDPHQSAYSAWRELNVEYVLRAFSKPAPFPVVPRARPGRRSDDDLTEVATTPEQLAAVADAWAALAEARRNPFVSPDWYSAWLSTCGSAHRPFVPLVRDADGKLRGLLPLVAATRSRFSGLAFAGADFGDYFHPVAAEGDDAAVASAAARVLAARRHDWAFFVADYVDRGSGWVNALRTNDALPLRVARYHDQASVYRTAVIGGRTWDDYLAERSRNFRSQLGRKQRALERDHDVVYRLADRASLVADIETLFELHRRRWSGRRTTVFATAGARAFHLAFARSALDRGWLRLWLLEVDGAPIAAWYGWSIVDRYLYYQAGFDPAWSDRSPGLLLLAHTLRAAFEEGAAAYDMLLGDEAYKARFADVERTAETLVFTRRGHPAGALVAADLAARRAARRLPRGAYRPLRAALSPLLGRWPIETAP